MNPEFTHGLATGQIRRGRSCQNCWIIQALLFTTPDGMAICRPSGGGRAQVVVLPLGSQSGVACPSRSTYNRMARGFRVHIKKPEPSATQSREIPLSQPLTEMAFKVC